MSQVRAGGAYVELTARSAQFLKGLEAAQKRLKSFGASTRLVGTKLTGLGVAAAAPVGASLAVYTSFDDAIRAAGAAANATGATLESLRNKAKHLGATTSFSASEVASLMTELGRAGFSPKQIEEMTGAVMNLARATGTDATVSSGIMSATIRQFSLEATDAVRVSDRLTAAANMSFNSVESLGEALQYAGPVAADANMSLEETLAILGTLGNLGIQGSEAGTALRRLLTLGAAESEKFQKVFGVATKDAQGNARDLVDILGEVAAASANMGSGDRAQAFNEVFGLMGITSASAIGKTVTDTKKLLADLKKSNGIADKTARDMDAGIGGAFRILKSSIEGVAIAIGESLDLSVTKMMNAISRALSGLIEWIGKNQEVVKKVALIVAGVVAVGAAFIGIGSAAGSGCVRCWWPSFDVLTGGNRDRCPCDHDRRAVHAYRTSCRCSCRTGCLLHLLVRHRWRSDRVFERRLRNAEGRHDQGLWCDRQCTGCRRYHRSSQRSVDLSQAAVDQRHNLSQRSVGRLHQLPVRCLGRYRLRNRRCADQCPIRTCKRMECDARFHGRWLDNPHDLGAEGLELHDWIPQEGIHSTARARGHRWRRFGADRWRANQCAGRR
jgi:TP901 family phage tail tape measure protein